MKQNICDIGHLVLVAVGRGRSDGWWSDLPAPLQLDLFLPVFRLGVLHVSAGSLSHRRCAEAALNSYLFFVPTVCAHSHSWVS